VSIGTTSPFMDTIILIKIWDKYLVAIIFNFKERQYILNILFVSIAFIFFSPKYHISHSFFILLPLFLYNNSCYNELILNYYF